MKRKKKTPAKERRHCWVIERCDVNGKWHEWHVCGTADAAKGALREYQESSPNFEFRIEIYVSTRDD